MTNRPSHTSRRRGPVIIALAVAVLAATVGVGIAMKTFLERRETGTAVPIGVVADGYSNQSATKIPVHVEGTDATGAEVERTAYIDSTGIGLSLEPGTYKISFPASPLTDSGALFIPPEGKTTLNITDEGVQQTEDQLTFTFEKAYYEDLSDEFLEEAATYATELGISSGRVRELLDAARAYKETIAPATYTYELKGPTGATATSSDNFTKIEFVSSNEDAPLEGINKELSDVMSEALLTEGEYTLYGGYVTAKQTLTYFSDGFACVMFDTTTNTGWSGDRETKTCRTFDLDHGFEVSPAEVVGISEEKLWSLAEDAIRTSLENEPSAMYWTSFESAFYETTMQENVTIIVASDGIYAWCGPGVLDYTDTRCFKLCDNLGRSVANGENVQAPLGEVTGEMQGRVSIRG